jgi:DNA repair exonuclease SbcCD ATPase subunit
MQIRSLEIENILSVESAKLAIEDAGLVLVEGWNYDAERSNGAGKSAIFNCISFALYDKIPRKITASEIVRRDCKKGSVKLEFNRGQDLWCVVRKRPKEVKFFKNHIEISLTQQEFENIIGLNYEQFLLTIYSAQSVSESNQRFLSCNDSEKKSFLLKLLNLDKFEDFKKKSDAKIKCISTEITEYEAKMSSMLSKIEAYEESLVDEQAINSQLSQLNKDIETVESKIKTLSEVVRPDLDKFNRLEDDIKNKMSAVVRAKAQREMLFNEFNKLKHNSLNEVCSECGSIVPEDRLKSQTESLEQLKSQIDDLDTLISKEAEYSNLLKKIRDKKRSESSEYDSAQAGTLELNRSLSIKQNNINNLTLKLENNRKFTNKINELKTSCLKVTQLVDENKRELDFYKVLSTVYSSTGAQAYVLDSVIDYFNEAVQKYVEILWPNVSYTLNSYRENNKGDITSKFSETLTMNGQVVSVGSLSGGEHKALSLCIDFALLDVISDQFSLQINPIILDEPFDGLDSSGREIVISLLENISRSRQIMVVDHASESKVLFSRVIRVEKRNGVSSILEQT